MRLIALSAVIFSLAACQSVGGGGCPPLVTYSAVQQKRAAIELRGIPQSQVAQMIVDYGKMRDACRIR